ncbi:hypothetical protein KCU83_g7351, partial [Aureobasidium melanogenum]
MVQELIGAFVEYEDSVGVSPPVIAIDTRPSPSRGPPAAARVPFSRHPPSSARSQSSMMGVFTVDNRAATAGSLLLPLQRLGLKIDRRKKNAAGVDADEDEEIEENEDGDEEQEDQDGEEMDTREA